MAKINSNRNFVRWSIFVFHKSVTLRSGLLHTSVVTCNDLRRRIFVTHITNFKSKILFQTISKISPRRGIEPRSAAIWKIAGALWQAAILTTILTRNSEFEMKNKGFIKIIQHCYVNILSIYYRHKTWVIHVCLKIGTAPQTSHIFNTLES